MKLAYISLGCPKNGIDLETILAGLDQQINVVEEVEKADAVLINTCAFIESAKQESIEAILAIGQFKKNRPQLKVLVSGCLSQRYRNELAAALPEVDKFFLSTDAIITRRQLRRFLHLPLTCSDLRKRITAKHYAYLRLAEGCDNRCSYCAIPLIKGRYISRPPADILQEANQLVADGCRELSLVAQDTTYYGRDRREHADLVKVLEGLCAIPSLQWIRLLYTHPAHYTPDLIRSIAELDKVVKYVDLPIQHIAEPMLARMRRHTTRYEIERLIDQLRSRIPDLAIRTTVMVGFPGESERDYQTLLQFIQAVRFERLGVFTYSAEEGTTAYRYRNSVPEKKKQQRYQEIMEVQAALSQEHNTSLIGRSLTVLADAIDPETKQTVSRSVWDAPEIDNTVIIDQPLTAGRFYQVVVTGADPFDLYAKID